MPTWSSAPTARRVLFTAPVDGSFELWRVPLDGSGEPVRLTSDTHYLSGWDAVPAGDRDLVVAVHSAATTLPEVVAFEAGATARADEGAATAEHAQRRAGGGDRAGSSPLDRRWQSDGREIQGWLYPAGTGRQPLVLEIHGGPHTLYGCAPMLEWQILAGRRGVSVLASNPRGSEGYGEAFNRANLGDWGDGPMADVLAGVDQAIEDGLADPDRLGVTGGSYGGYLTNWIVGKTDRFKAAITCRSVVDMRTLFLTGDISGGEWARDRVRARPVGGPAVLRLDLAAVVREGHPHAAADPALGARPADDGRARPRRCSRSCARSSDRSGSCACPTRATSSRAAAPPYRRAENLRPGARLVRALPGPRRAPAAGAAQEPRRPLDSRP